MGRNVLDIGKNLAESVKPRFFSFSRQPSRFFKGTQSAVKPEQLDDWFHQGYMTAKDLANPTSSLSKSIHSSPGWKFPSPTNEYLTYIVRVPQSQYHTRIQAPQEMPNDTFVQTVFDATQDYAKDNRLPWRTQKITYHPEPLQSNEHNVLGQAGQFSGEIEMRGFSPEWDDANIRAIKQLEAAAHEPFHHAENPIITGIPMKGVDIDNHYLEQLGHPILKNKEGVEEGTAGLTEWAADSHGLGTLQQMTKGEIDPSNKREYARRFYLDLAKENMEKPSFYRQLSAENVIKALQDPNVSPEWKARMLGHLEYMQTHGGLLGGQKANPTLLSEFNNYYDQMGRAWGNEGFWW